MKKLRLKEKQFVQTHNYEVARTEPKLKSPDFPVSAFCDQQPPLTMITGETTNRSAKNI